MLRVARVGRSILAGALGCAVALAYVPASYAVGEKAFADLKTRDGKDVGRIKLVETTAGILIRLRL